MHQRKLVAIIKRRVVHSTYSYGPKKTTKQWTDRNQIVNSMRDVCGGLNYMIGSLWYT